MKNKILKIILLWMLGIVIGVLLVASIWIISDDYQKVPFLMILMQPFELSYGSIVGVITIGLIIFVVALYFLVILPQKHLLSVLNNIRSGKDFSSAKKVRFHIFSHLLSEIIRTGENLNQARKSAREEARLSLEKLSTPWTAERLREYLAVLFRSRKVYVVSNREPYIHKRNGDEIKIERPASGLVTALEPIMQACGGMWIAQASGNADRETADKSGTISVPPDDPKYTLKRVWLSQEENDGFYSGFSNEGIWPLCHLAHTRPVFKRQHWVQYERVNRKFAEICLTEMTNQEKPVIFIQDFHFALLPKLIKEKRPDALVALFWHIPWPNAESFRICPWRKEIITGLLGADLLGFHVQLHCNNFLDTVSHECEAILDRERFAVMMDVHRTFIRPFPISIAFTGSAVPKPEERDIQDRMAKLRNDLNLDSVAVGLGVDRMDYTKGILERFRAIEIFFDRYKEYLRRFTFVQIASPSRETVAAYRDFANDVTEEAKRINKKFQSHGWKPIILIHKHHDWQSLQVFYRLADVCVVTSLHDGMNLVAKEYISTRIDQQGVLILSEFTGAARELTDALIINPYDADRVAESIYTALRMPKREQESRMKHMQDLIKNNNVFRWSADMLKSLAVLEKV